MEHFGKASIKIRTSGVPPSVQIKKGKENTMDTQPKEDHRKKPRPKRKAGFQVFKTIAALRLASRKEGVNPREMGEKLQLSHAAAYGTLEALVEAGEVVKDKNRYYSDVFSKDEPNPLVKREESSSNDRKMVDAQTLIRRVLDAQQRVIKAYPTSVFGEAGYFITNVAKSIVDDILEGLPIE